jgi:O-antigen/teichoic acid export membrane protein
VFAAAARDAPIGLPVVCMNGIANRGCPRDTRATVDQSSRVGGRRRAAAVNFVFNYAGLLLNIAKGLVLVPVYLHFFSLATYGAWLASGNIMGILGLLDGGFTGVLLQRVSKDYGKRDYGSVARTVGSGLAVVVSLGTTVLLSGVVLSRFIPVLVNAEMASRHSISRAFVLESIGSAAYLAQASILGIPMAWQRMLGPNTIRITSQIIEIATIVVGITSGLGVVALGLATCVGGAAGLLFAMYYLVRTWRILSLPRPRLVRRDAVGLLATTAPVFLGRSAGLVASNSEATLISNLAGPASAAIFSLTDSVFKMAQSFVDPVAGSAFYGLAHMAGDKGVRETRGVLHEIVQLSTVITGLMVAGALAINQGFIKAWVGPDKLTGLPLVALLALSSILVIRTNLLGVVLMALGEITSTAWIGILDLVVRLPLMIVLIKCVGLVGVPVAVIASTLATSIWLMVRMVSRTLGLRGREAAGLQCQGMTSMVFCLALGCSTALLPLPRGWPALVGRTAWVGALLVSTALALSPVARTRLRAIARRWIVTRPRAA